MSEKLCRNCQQKARLLYCGDAGYPYRCDYGPVWICLPCKAWVGCHKGTEKALGCLATAEHREWKIKAHAAFDPLWKRKIENEQCSKGHARRAGYKWLSQQLGIPESKTHIGYMNIDECKRVVEVCQPTKELMP